MNAAGGKNLAAPRCRSGFFNMLAPTFGVGAFDVGGHRFATYVQGVTPSAASFRDAWRALRRFVAGENPVDDMPDRDTSPAEATVLRRSFHTGDGQRRMRGAGHAPLFSCLVVYCSSSAIFRCFPSMTATVRTRYLLVLGSYTRTDTNDLAGGARRGK